MGKSRLVRAPNEFLSALGNICKVEGIPRKTDGMRKMARYAEIGREIVHKDLLRANTLWFESRPKRKR